jgi:hypothetical protein
MDEALESKNYLGVLILGFGLMELHKEENEMYDKQVDLFDDISDFSLYMESIQAHIKAEDLLKLLATTKDFV